MKKKIDERIRILIENCVKLNQRGLIMLVGDRSLYQVVNLHYMLAKSRVKAQPNVLWCYKKELEFSSNKQKRMKQIKKQETKGNLDKEEINQIELFMSSKEIRYCYYKDTHKILGQTYGMCVLQDFESITPNVLCRTMETVEGGGLVIMLFNTMTSLKQLYTISMDVHQRYRTEAHQVVEPRFNERFILSLSSCKTCIAIDDELNILPITSHMKEIKEVQVPGAQGNNGEIKSDNLYLTKEQKELKDLKQQLKDTKPIGNLVNICKTLDQARAVMQIVDTVSEKSLKTTVSLTAGRGRGKSAGLGISIASAIVYGFSNIFVTAPSPENLKSVFEFVFKGLDALGFKEHQDYEILQSTNPEFNNAVVRVNIYRDHRQTIQYIRPQDHIKLSQAELLVIDEAAAIPITLVKQLLGPYLVFLSSTINGYEGTGRSLSLKLIQQLREQNRLRITQQSQSVSGYTGRILKEVQLDEPIRYSPNDPIEKWQNDLLCLNCTDDYDILESGYPHPNSCDLYSVNRDTLFSYHSSSEDFLKKLMSIFVSSHYKNTPNDLLLLSDAPAHQIFVLLGPLNKQNKGLPDILCAIQVCFEGEISKSTVQENLKRGMRPSGDLIPWTVSEQFQDESFASLNGLRIIRIATHPSAQGKGYGSRALELLIKYYENQLTDFDNIQVDESEELNNKKTKKTTEIEQVKPKDEKIKPKKHLKPILQKLSERKPFPIHYLGTSFGLTKELYNFWTKNKFFPLYLRLTANELTGEHTCLMIRPLKNTEQAISLPDQIKKYADEDTDESWAGAYTQDFRKRLLNLLGFEFSKLPCSLSLQLVNPQLKKVQSQENQDETAQINQIKKEELENYISVFDLKRLESYSKNLVDFHLVMDLVPTIAKMYFQRSVLPKGTVSLSYTQAALLLGMGLQHKTIDDLQNDLNLQANQLLPLFNKGIRKFTRVFREVYEKEIAKELEMEEDAKNPLKVKGIKESLNEELNKGDTNLTKKMKDEKTEFISNFQKHQIKSSDKDFEQAVGQKQNVNVVSVPKTKRDTDESLEQLEKKVKKDKKNKRQKK